MTEQPTIQPTKIPISQMEPKKNSLPLILCGMVLLLLIIVASVYAGMKIQERKTERAQIPSPDSIIDYNLPASQAGLVTCSPCPQFMPPHPDFCQDGVIVPGKIDECGCQMPLTCDRTVNWKTYTNNKCGYEIKYPPSWSLIPEPEDAIYGAAVIFPYEIGSGIKPPPEWFKVQISCGDRKAGMDPKSIIDQVNEINDGYGIPQIKDLKKITVNGLLAYSEEKIPTVGDPILEYFIFPEGKIYYNLSFTPATTTSPNTVDQILSTFKFLD